MSANPSVCLVCGGPKRSNRSPTCGFTCGQRLWKMNRAEQRMPVAVPPPPPAPREVAMPAGRPVSDERNKQKIGLSPIRVCVFDIETTDLSASMGRVLCAVVKSYDGGAPQRKVFRADEYEPWKSGRRSDDSHLVAEILAHLEEFDVWIGHNAVRFDAPFLRTRAMIGGLPPVMPAKIYDPVLLARKLLRFKSNSLDHIATLIGATEEKTRVDPGMWARAILDGDPEAMNYIVEHCIKDVDVLEEVAYALRGYVRVIDSLGSFR